MTFEWLPIIVLLSGLMLGLVSGFPMAFTLAGSSIIASWIFIGFDSLPYVATNVFGMMSNMILIAMLTARDNVAQSQTTTHVERATPATTASSQRHARMTLIS